MYLSVLLKESIILYGEKTMCLANDVRIVTHSKRIKLVPSSLYNLPKLTGCGLKIVWNYETSVNKYRNEVSNEQLLFV